ncbi:carboxyl transferase domain-containing protein [Reyranella sp.]|uniref:carboxyl transferase domain-containing protein n=1 Tax=Reyranella sp. TaxID=1929291 RepID=UPI001217C590|nr:carboxyl transferase domain-containing protein [Reyranella sp.]TAJ88060.1 MAG: biotin/lipoyl-binding protein [Reyranella sp.]
MLKKLLIANRGEIAIRIAQAAAELGIATVGIHSEDDATSLHVRRVDDVQALKGRGAAAYLDIAGVIAAAKAAGCDSVHPGYGFLSENAAFAKACAQAGLVFVGPTPEQLDLFGDKAQARAHAIKTLVPLLPGTDGAADLAGVRAFFEKHAKSGVMIKAIAGGGGRGMRPVRQAGEISEAFERCAAEAKSAFGNPALYAERLIDRARHIEVQIVGDGEGGIVALGERDCTVQRRNQKIVELAPSPHLSATLRLRIVDAAIAMAKAVKYRSLGTFEFLVDDAAQEFFFIEANPRLQVEHTVTEEVYGVDLVKAQLRLAAGTKLAETGLAAATPRGHAIQLRINMETMTADGSAKPGGGTLTAFEPPSGPGVRVDTYGYAGYRTNPNFDSLLAKVIVHAPSPDFGDALTRAERALAAFRLEGAPSNIAFLRALIAHPDFRADKVYTRFVDDHAGALIEAAAKQKGGLYFEPAATSAAPSGRQAGARVDSVDPLAVLAFGKARADTAASGDAGSDAPEGTVAVPAPMQGTIVSIAVREGDAVAAGQALLIMDAMKMQHEIRSPARGYVWRIAVEAGETIYEGHSLLFVEEADVEVKGAAAEEKIDLDHIRPDLGEYLERRAMTLDEKRPDAVERRRKTNQRTARQNLDDLVDPNSFVEYGAFAIASQRSRRTIEDLIEKTPADGLITGIGRVNGSLFGPERSRVAVAHYDYTVLAGTQGKNNHHKKDRLFEIVEKQRIPLVFFTEGGGGRPGDIDVQSVAGLNTMAFHIFGRLSGVAPLVGINSGRCFAGNAAILGCCDVVIATKNSSIGMGGPAMIEGGNLGVFSPEEVGPMSVQVPNGVVDIAVEDEAEAVAVAKQYLSYFQGSLPEWRAADQRLLRRAIPENRLRVYDVRDVIATLCDEGSVLELRRAFGPGMVTAFARIEGKPLGIVANNPVHLAGAIDSDGSDKAARFLQLCDAYDIPILFLCDTPGMMVGPEIEKTALVRHCSRLFVTGANLTVPFGTIVLRKAYGLGAQAMAGGSFHAPAFALSWPTGEFGGMGLEGAVKLGYRKELEAVTDPAERRALFDEMVAAAYARGKALSTATYFEIDEVIDPADSRRWITTALLSAERPPATGHKKRPNIDTW